MTRYVIGPDVALQLARDQAVNRGGHQILAPALLCSQLLSLLYRAVRRGEVTRKDAERQLDYVRGLRIRLLSDCVLQNLAWTVADQLAWPDTPHSSDWLWAQGRDRALLARIVRSGCRAMAISGAFVRSWLD
jgi:hypothetical protein